MKFVKYLILSFVIVLGLSMEASAQKQDPRKRPKENPPIVTPAEKDPPREKPPKKGGDRNRGGKKPGMAMLLTEQKWS